jgi:hypothetical protein
MTETSLIDMHRVAAGVKGVMIKNKLPISGELDTPPGDP